MARDPVCGMYVDESKATIKSVRYGRTYYFCSETCKEQFEKPEKEFKKLKISLIVSWALTIPTILITYFFNFKYFSYLLFLFGTIVQFYPGFRFYRGSFDAIKNRMGNMDLLIAVGTTTAWAYSVYIVFFPHPISFSQTYFDTSTVIISLVLTGNYLETLAKSRASKNVSKLLSIQPKKIIVIENGKVVEKNTEDLKIGDIILVKKGETIPTDSTIIEGTTEIDESMMTGEFMPVKKGAGDFVIGGTINIGENIIIRAKNVGEDTILSKIIDIVENASASKVPIQRLADKISSIFVPIVLLIAISAFIYWFLFANVGLTYSILIMVTVIIISCPCALGVATPAALVVAVSKAAEMGMIVKSGEAIETSSKVNAVLFDKTGTLTEGSLSVFKVLTFNNFDEKDLLYYASSAEITIDHPVARAIMKYVKEKGIIPEIPKNVKYFTGEGVVWQDEHLVLVGSRNFLIKNGISIKNDTSEFYEVYVAIDGKLAEVILLSDRIRDNAKVTIEKIKEMGIDVFMITGDNVKSAKKVADALGIQNFFAGLTPEGKLKKIEELKQHGLIIAMVGDGINDAPALIKSDVGIAMGSASDISKETGDVIIIKNDLKAVYSLLKLSRKTMKKIKQNLLWAFFYNSILIPVAAGALVPIFSITIYDFLPFIAAIAMSFSSTTVVTNSLTIKFFIP